MKLIKRLTWSAAFAAGLCLGSAAYAQQAPPPDSSPNNNSQEKKVEPAAITGELTRVNPTSMSFAVKAASGAEMVFRYDEKTIVTGAESNVAGLATSNGAEVTVTYRNDSAGNMASKIEVHAKR